MPAQNGGKVVPMGVQVHDRGMMIEVSIRSLDCCPFLTWITAQGRGEPNSEPGAAAICPQLDAELIRAAASNPMLYVNSQSLKIVQLPRNTRRKAAVVLMVE